jgi:hypothetical protein
MRLYDWFWNWLTQPRTRPLLRARPPRRRHVRLALVQLEDRVVMSNYTAGTVADLIADINAANSGGGSNTITLLPGTTFTLTAVNNTTDGATGLPVIAANDTLTVVGNGDTIQRSTAKGTPAFRLFDVASGASLTLASLIVQNGLAQGNGVAAEGGAMLNQGSLTLNGVTVQNNMVKGAIGADGTVQQPQGGSGGEASGGGIYSSGGALTLESGTVIQNNEAIGGNGGNAKGGNKLSTPPGGRGGNAYGGGVASWNDTVTISNATISNNEAIGGNGGSPFGTVDYGFSRAFGGALWEVGFIRQAPGA